MSRYLLLLSLVLSCSFAANAQPNPVKWTFAAEHIKDGEYKVTFTAVINKGWYVYSQHLEDGGPIPTSVEFNAADHFSLSGKTEETGEQRKEGFDELFSMNVIKYAGRAVFSQHIRVTDPSVPVEGSVTFMTCDDDQCLPPRTVPFQISLAK